MIATLGSPWYEHFLALVRAAREQLVLASPYVTEAPLKDIAEALSRLRRLDVVSVQVITDLSATNLLDGSVDATALGHFLTVCPRATVTHCPGLHAKVYIADVARAIVTSANLTLGGLLHNYEYGVLVSEPRLVMTIKADVSAYAALGAGVVPARLQAMAAAAQQARQARDAAVRSARRELRSVFERELERTQIEVLRARAAGRSTQSILSDTLVYLLSRGAAPTEQLHLRIQEIHPDICDDTVDRVIDSVHFGKKWKHFVRSAQQALKRRGLIELVGRVWRLRQQD